MIDFINLTDKEKLELLEQIGVYYGTEKRIINLIELYEPSNISNLRLNVTEVITQGYELTGDTRNAEDISIFYAASMFFKTLMLSFDKMQSIDLNDKKSIEKTYDYYAYGVQKTIDGLHDGSVRFIKFSEIQPQEDVLTFAGRILYGCDEYCRNIDIESNLDNIDDNDVYHYIKELYVPSDWTLKSTEMDL